MAIATAYLHLSQRLKIETVISEDISFREVMSQIIPLLRAHYHLSQQLSNNAGRQTWLARDLTTTPQSLVIVKLLAFSPQMQWEEFKLFEREAQVLKSLNHPCLPRYRDFFSIDAREGGGLRWFALVQDYIPGKSLQQLLDEGYHFNEQQVQAIAIQVLKILRDLHRLNPPILHRDLKPSNLIVGLYFCRTFLFIWGLMFFYIPVLIFPKLYFFNFIH